MIKIDEHYTIRKDSLNWILTEKKMQVMTKGKFIGEEKEVENETYHPTFDAIAKAIINRSSSNCETLEELIDLYKNAIQNLGKHIKFIYKDAENTTENTEKDNEKPIENEEEPKPKKSIKKLRRPIKIRK